MIHLSPATHTNTYVIPLGSSGSFDLMMITLDNAMAFQPIDAGDEIHATAMRVELRAREPGWVIDRVGPARMRRRILPGGFWRMPEMARIAFTATEQEHPLRSDRRVPGDPGTVTSTAIGFGNVFGVTSRRSGATERVLSTFVVRGTLLISMDVHGHDYAWLLGSNTPVPFTYERQTNEVELEDTVRHGPGVGVNIGGWDPEASTHIVSPVLPRGISQAQGPRH